MSFVRKGEGKHQNELHMTDKKSKPITTKVSRKMASMIYRHRKVNKPTRLTLKVAGTEAKREYNRRNAARVRKRKKHMVGGLQRR
jgi:hypothetical protein